MSNQRLMLWRFHIDLMPNAGNLLLAVLPSLWGNLRFKRQDISRMFNFPVYLEKAVNHRILDIGKSTGEITINITFWLFNIAMEHGPFIDS